MDAAFLTPIRLRLEARLRSRALTRALAHGAEPSRDEALALRARTLATEHERRAVAAGIDNVVAAAEERRLHWTAAAPFDAAGVLEARDDLVELASRLRSSAPVSACGVARAELLLTDYDSPLNRPGGEHELRDAARAAIAACGWLPA